MCDLAKERTQAMRVVERKDFLDDLGDRVIRKINGDTAMSMTEVSRDHFFQAVGGPENIHPTPWPEFSEWKNLNTHATVGKSEPGYLSSFFKPKRYWLEESFASRKPYKPTAGQQDLFAA